jgi:hypothetical protein
MSYSEVQDVKARAGKLAPAWDVDTNPGDTDIERFLDDVAAQIDQTISAQGFATPLTGQGADALRGLNADGALVLTLEATFPADTGPAAAKAIHDGALERFNAGMAALQNGTFSAIAYLRSQASASGATDFWTENPQYGMEPLPGTTNPF